MRHHPSHRNILWTVLCFILAALFLNGCGNVNDVASTTPPPPQPGPLTILTSSPLPAATTTVSYDITLAATGGTPPYSWSLVPGSPALPDGLVLVASTGKISGTPTTTGTTPTEFKLKDSTGKSVQKVLSITVNIAPTPLAILTNSLLNGSINQLYAFALSPTGGTTPYTWDLKPGSTPLPNGLTLGNNGVITGTPTVTSNETHIFTLTDATSLTVEKSLRLSINAIPLSITTNSPLPRGTVHQPYTRTLTATGGTPPLAWTLDSGSLPAGLTLSTAGVISGTPTAAGTSNFTIQVSDSTLPTPQSETKPLQLIIGAAPPTLTITTPAGSSLPSGSVGSAYSTFLDATGGTGADTWSITSGALPNGLLLNPSTGAITGTPQVGSNGTTSLTVRVQDSGTPQQSVQKTLSITISLPAPPKIATTSLPAGTFDVAYNQTISVTGGIGTLVWGVTTGGLPPGLNLDPSNGNISGTPATSGSFQFTVRVTDSIPLFDQQDFTITISAPTPPSITTSSLPAGTVNQPYSNTQLTATGGTQPYSWSVNPTLPNGLTFNPSSGVISGTPLSGSDGNSTHQFSVTDSTIPINQEGKRTLSLTIITNGTPVTITTASLPNGRMNQAYAATLAVSGGTIPYSWSVAPALPAELTLDPAMGVISGIPTATSDIKHDFTVRDSTNQTITKELRLRIRKSAPSDDDDDDDD